MRKVVLVLVVLLVAVPVLQAKKLGVLPELLIPDAMAVSGERLFVVQGATFLVYSLKDLKLVSQFGGKGEGPNELIKSPIFPNNIREVEDKLVAEGLNKVILYSKDFKPLKEVRKKKIMFRVVPVGENYAALKLAPSQDSKKVILALSVYDSELNEIKELYRQENVDRRGEIIMLRDTVNFAVYKKKIYIEKSAKGFLIDVLDSNGNKLYEIKKEYRVQKVTEEDKKVMKETLKEDVALQGAARRVGGWENFEKQMTFTFPDNYPVIKDISVINDKIYVSTFEKKGDKEKYIIMDLKGKILKNTYMPIPKNSSFLARTMGRQTRSFGISNGNYYYLVENEEEEQWEIYVTEIN